MRYLTDRKRAVGRGASGTGTEHHWSMTVSSVGLALLVPTFLFFVGSAIGGTRAEVLEMFSRPFPAILTALVLVVGMNHFRKGAQMMIEDYWRGITRKILVIGAIILSYGTVAAGLFALAKIAL